MGHPVYSPDEFARALDVSRETMARLKLYVSLLAEWNTRHNLVAARSLEDAWRRHVLDSAQLLRLIPEGAATLVDLGSGAGFPGMVLALMNPAIKVTLVEATAKKTRFLSEVARRTGTDVDIRTVRIEDCKPERLDVITARACAPLGRLLFYAQRFVGSGSVCLFLKGQNVGSELTATPDSWRMELKHHKSLSDPSGTILEVRLAPHERHAG